MLSAQFIRDNVELVKNNMEKKFLDSGIVDDFLSSDSEWRKLTRQAEDLKHERNKVSEQINAAKKSGKDVTPLIAKAKDIPQEIRSLEEQQERLQAKSKELLSKIPNVMHDSVKQGKDASENLVIRTVGHPKKFSFPVKNHVELAEGLGIADFDASAKISGNGFYFLEGELALLDQALIRFAIDFMHRKGYRYIETPLMIKHDVLAAATDTNAFRDSIYSVEGDDTLCLIGTSEYSMLGRYMDTTFQEQELPKRIFSYSMCFRKEIGSHGINEKGLWRTHQFNKVEQIIFCRPEESYDYYEELLKNSEEIMLALEMPYRIVECCSGDLSAWKSRSADIEVWRPTVDGYGEIMSLSNCTDYQARDLNIRLVRKDGSREVVHTLNNTALATSRMLVAILENYQNEDGSITVPRALVPYMQGIKKISKKK